MATKEDKKLEKEVSKLEHEKKRLNLSLARQKAKSSVKEFKKELKSAVLTAIVAAFGFLLALSWRELISQWVDQISSRSPVKNSLVEVAIITFISVIGILIVTYFFSERKEID
ncbi:hypothetical protein COU53_03920 [Candidatus Pacearchaeota archaeon CG10_big_fil_rev_8_21_14_0_10_30_48]|nr:MAG: hypothetical protein COU53_03920 [Candidatus Pacearchaeota archaeon CG10_big_fil_rev_8_21_14_0_10_30_48]